LVSILVNPLVPIPPDTNAAVVRPAYVVVRKIQIGDIENGYGRRLDVLDGAVADHVVGHRRVVAGPFFVGGNSRMLVAAVLRMPDVDGCRADVVERIAVDDAVDCVVV
jgi:hypothetical protein